MSSGGPVLNQLLAALRSGSEKQMAEAVEKSERWIDANHSDLFPEEIAPGSSDVSRFDTRRLVCKHRVFGRVNHAYNAIQPYH